MRSVIDEQTGFERQSLNLYLRQEQTSQPADQKQWWGQETRQFLPTMLPTGVAYPKLSITAHYKAGNLNYAQVTFIDKIELLERVPAEAFIIAAPAGTNILDYRGIPRNAVGRPPMGVVSAPVPDVVAHRNRFAPAREPVLKPGDAAPELDVVSWLDAAGKDTRPELGGKIVVIDFWGIGCGPCVAQLPEVNAAARRFAGSKIVVIGLHDKDGKPEQVAELVKQRGLAFPIAIDKPDAAGSGFGATFTAFGISAIPCAVVLDASGGVAYIGQFAGAIETANRLAGGK